MRLHAHYRYLVEQINELEAALEQALNRNEAGQQLLTIPDVGPITASVLSSQLGDSKQYARSRDFAASTGLVPRQYSTGGKKYATGNVNVAIKICDGCWFSVPEFLSSASTINRDVWPAGLKRNWPENTLV
ncbi:transposase for insertion sequence element IS1328 [Photorhabdus temperata subsp. temperata M1021]|nr:transposase for insertion sequence element IS1328 [Photorhabdus temperata subsp. temperata M1021]